MMSKSLSGYIDLLRISAALVVFFDHFSDKDISGGLFWQFARFGHSAVIVFFVLSGFVITYAAETKEPSFGDYATARLARLLSVTVPALLLTVLCDSIGQLANPSLYSDGYSGDHVALRLFSAITFTSQIWNVRIITMSNLPYWSLPYEFWYYVVFAGVYYLRGWQRMAWCATGAAIAGPKIMLLWPLWLLGAVCWRYQRRIAPNIGRALFVGSIVGIVLLELCGGDSLFQHSIGPWWPEKFSAYDYLLGLLVAVNLLGAATIEFPVWRSVGAAAGLTFSLYLYHLPLLMVLRALSPGPPSETASRAIVGLGSLAIIMLLGHFTERRKHLVRQWIRRGFSSAARQTP